MHFYQKLRGILYDWFIPRLTARWYRSVIELIPQGCQLLDVGIGTGSALLKNTAEIRGKGIHVTGIDIDADYIARAQHRLLESGLKGHVELKLESVYDHQGGPYDAIYFSASFMLLPDPQAALHHCYSLLKPNGRLYFTQTFQQQPSTAMEWLKPMLKRLTSIDFGRVTYEAKFRAEIQAAGLVLERFTTLARHGNRAYCLAVAK